MSIRIQFYVTDMAPKRNKRSQSLKRIKSCKHFKLKSNFPEMFLQYGPDDDLYVKTRGLLKSYKYKKRVVLVVKTEFLLLCCHTTYVTQWGEAFQDS